MNQRKIAIGAWTTDLRDNTSKKLQTNKLHEFEKSIGKQIAIAHIYIGWHELDSDHFLDNLNELSDNNWVPMVSSNPYFFDECKPTGASLYKTIASGACDSFLHKVGKRMHSFDKLVLFRFAWEMNIPTNEWSLNYSQSDPKDFIAAWRRFHTIMNEEKAINVRWVFNPFIKASEEHEFEFAYPGDLYVDYVGLDGYNWGTTQSWSSWKNFHDTFYSSYTKLGQIAPGKPVIIGEVGSTDVGGNKPAWFLNMLTEEIPENFPLVRAIVFYNEDRTRQEQVNWTINVPPATLEAIRQGLSNSLYSSKFKDSK